ncbi:hypothetical protein D3C78_1905490 [compost metagenome]
MQQGFAAAMNVMAFSLARIALALRLCHWLAVAAEHQAAVVQRPGANAQGAIFQVGLR